jgi:ABC-type antimicrobial peptide transport system permease subunit
LQEGEPFTDIDVRSGARVCLMGQTPARELFGDESPVGKEVRVRGVRLLVVGVLTRKGANMMGMDQDDLVVAPWTTVKFQINGSKLAFAQEAVDRNVASLTQVNTLSKFYPISYLPQQLYPQRSPLQAADTPQLVRFADLDDIFISVNTPEEIPQAVDEITQLLRHRHRIRPGEPDDFGIRNWVEGSNALAANTRVMLLLWIALVSLVVGGVGVMNIMLVSVTERTREFGLRMAVGARPAHVLRQFLTEAVMLCLMGGIVGIVVGRGASIAVREFLRWPTIPSLTAVVASVAISVLVGLASGYYPAWKASRLDPIEALRHE